MDTSRDVPLKEYPEEYTEGEVGFLRGRWSEKDIDEVEEWLDAGADPDERPECVTILDEVGDSVIYDLRGVNLGKRLTQVRTKKMPKIDLSYARLEHADLRKAHLEHAYLEEAHLEHAYLGRVHLEHARLWEAYLEHAYLGGANLEQASLRLAHLERADFIVADLRGVDLSNVNLDDTVFRVVKWRPSRRRLPSPDLYKGFDVRGIRYSDPLFDQFVRQSEFIRGCRETLPKWLFWIWKLTCECGRSFKRLLVVCLLVILIFTHAYYWPAFYDRPIVAVHHSDVAFSPITELYFSVVTFSTLGFGDVTPCNATGQIVVMIEVLLGYVALGALISVFSVKILPPR